MEPGRQAPRRIRLGMIGGGQGSFIGPVHRMAARLDDRYELVAGAYSSKAARNTAGARSLYLDPSRVYADWRRMLSAESERQEGRLDAIAIVTPNHLHCHPAIACLDAG